MIHQLSGTRNLGYAEYGDRNGIPAFFFHGTPGSRLFHPPDEITKQSGVRLICVERPGYGDSTFQPKRRILDWPADVASLADALQIDKFMVLGHSGGGPYALACAYAMPTRVTAAAILSGAGPVDTPHATEGMMPLNRFGFKFGQYIPWPIGYAITKWVFREKAANPARVIDIDQKDRPSADNAVFEDPKIREICVQSDIEAYRQGMLGIAWDIRLITQPWGFRLEDIKVPVFIWHGPQDNSTSLHMARHMASKIPGSQLTICEGEAHMLLIPHWKNILARLTQATVLS